MRVLVCGSRKWTDKWFVFRTLSALAPDEIIVGGAKGPDTYAETWATNIAPHSVLITRITPDWNKHGRAAGIIRNNEMLDKKPQLVIAFWDGESPGTRHTITEARKRGISVEVYYESAGEPTSADRGGGGQPPQAA